MYKSMTRACELCANAFADCNFEEIVQATRDILNVLLIQVSINKNRPGLMCQYCSDKVKILYDFKSACIYTEDFIFPFVDAEEKNQVDLKELYIKEHATSTNILLHQNVCRLCMKVVDAGFVSLDERNSRIDFITSLIEKCVPEVIISNTKYPVVCDACVHLLEDYSIFLDSCAYVVDKKIKYRCPENETDVSNKETFTGEETNYGKIKIERMEDEAFNSFELRNKEECTEQCKNEPYNDESSESVTLPAIKCEGGLNVKAEVSSEQSRKNFFKCDLCHYKTKRERRLANHNLLVHTPPSESEWYKCNSCDHKSKRKRNLRKHMSMHKNPSEIQWSKCDLCDFKTKQKLNLKQHMLIHKNPSEIDWFECHSCDFKTKQKRFLKRHMLNHKNPSDIDWYKCDKCDYKAKKKSSLKAHDLLMHKDPSEIDWFKCDLCAYKAKNKKSLKLHTLNHADPSEIEWFACDLCKFKSKLKYNLTKHMLVHKDPSEIQWFECNLCDSKFKRKADLVKHLSRNNH